MGGISVGRYKGGTKQMKKEYLAMKKHSGIMQFADTKHRVNLQLPEGCTGMLFVFKTKKAAREFWGKDIELMEVGKQDD